MSNRSGLVEGNEVAEGLGEDDEIVIRFDAKTDVGIRVSRGASADGEKCAVVIGSQECRYLVDCLALTSLWESYSVQLGPLAA
jgi:hypothetical protein